MQEFAFQRALAALWEFIGGINRYVDSNQPWALAKDPLQRPRLDRVLVTLADALGYLGVMLTAFLPDAAAKIRVAIGQTAAPRLADAEIGRLDRLPAVQKLSGLFPRVESKDKAAPADQPAADARRRRPQRPTRQRPPARPPSATSGASICVWPR
jgi:methionyl-tRNA synthetase